MRALRQLLGLEPRRDDARDTKTVLRIARELDSLPADEARFLAAFAYVLARVARADLEVSDAEMRTMVEIVQEYSDLPTPQATLVVTMAKTMATTLGGTENYVVTRQFREMANRAQRVDLLRCLFAVAASDESISSVESAEITRIGTELGFAPDEIVAVRSAFRNQLADLKGLRSEEPDEK